MEEEEARRAQQLLLHGHHHWTPSSWSPQPASFVAPFCSLLLLLCRCGLAAAPNPWRICPTNAPWIKRYKMKPPAGDTYSSGPTECQFMLLCYRWSLMCIDKAMIDKGQHCLPFSCPEFVQGLVDFDEDLASVLKLASNCITLKHRICACTLHPWDMDTLHMDFPLCNNSPSLSASLSYT